MHILMTGAPGALGSELLRLLEARGHEVTCIVRAESRNHARKRVSAIVQSKRIRGIRGDITEPRCGISDIDYEHLRGKIDCIIHSAASISFTDVVETQRTNVVGVHHILELADMLDVLDFRHISTSYVCGDLPEFGESDLPNNIDSRPRNAYEDTKRTGETLVRAWAANRDDRECTIYRPSILIGRKDGTTPTFDAFYGYFRICDMVAEMARKMAREDRKLPPDVVVAPDGTVDMPLVLRASQNATLNLISIDWAAAMIAQLIEVPARDTIVHLVNPAPPLVTWVIHNSLRKLKISGVQVAATDEEKQAMIAGQSTMTRRVFQRMLDQALTQFEPYTTHGPHFNMAQPQALLGKAYRPMPPLDLRRLDLMIEYALKTAWGTKQPTRELVKA